MSSLLRSGMFVESKQYPCTPQTHKALQGRERILGANFSSAPCKHIAYATDFVTTLARVGGTNSFAA